MRRAPPRPCCHEVAINLINQHKSLASLACAQFCCWVFSDSIIQSWLCQFRRPLGTSLTHQCQVAVSVGRSWRAPSIGREVLPFWARGGLHPLHFGVLFQTFVERIFCALCLPSIEAIYSGLLKITPKLGPMLYSLSLIKRLAVSAGEKEGINWWVHLEKWRLCQRNNI